MRVVRLQKEVEERKRGGLEEEEQKCVENALEEAGQRIARLAKKVEVQKKGLGMGKKKFKKRYVSGIFPITQMDKELGKNCR